MLSRLRIRQGLTALLDKLFPAPVTIRDHLRQNLIIGMIVVLLVTLFQNSDFIRSNREKSLDWLMRMHRGITVTEGREFRPFVYYDIDERSHEAWGEPFAVPRRKLAALITAALARKPAVLVVDVELLRPTPEDDALLEVLRAHAAHPTGTSIVLLRGFKWKEDAENGDYLMARSSFLEAAAPASSSLMWASPLFERDPDGQIRRWKLWQSACSIAGSPQLVPSVQLVALAAMEGTDATATLGQALSSAALSSCNAEPERREKAIDIGRYRFSTSGEPFGQRILFSFPWKLQADEARPEVSFGGTKVRLLSIIPAHAVTEGGMRPEVPAGHIAVIGASHQDARDTHVTPFGVMPGSLILINAMHSLIEYGQLATPPLWLQLITAAILLVGVSFIFMKFPSLKGAVVSLAVLMVLLVPMSMYLFRYGVWLDFALPLTAVKGFQIAMEFHRKHINKKGAKT